MSQNMKATDQKNDQSLANNLALKSKYLQELKDALAKHNDLLVYKLLNITKYYHVIKKKRYDNNHDYIDLIEDLRPELSHHLSVRLIKYLKRIYPFFYYHENHLGHYQVYFGDWWGHRLFGSLDVINVKFDFKKTEYVKLRQAFNSQDMATQNMKRIKQQNQKLTKLLKAQNKRTNEKAELKSDLKANQAQVKMPWNSARINANHTKITTRLNRLNKQNQQAQQARTRIQANQQKMLELSKASTVIGYEKRSINKYFGRLDQFDESNKQLYYNYISNLLAGGKD